jgi:hypothetical protein
MRKVIGLLALATALGVLAAGGTGPADAQVKDPKKKMVKDKKGAKDPPPGTVEVYKAKDGFRFRIKDAAGRTIAISVRSQDTSEEVEDDLDAIQAALNNGKRVIGK